MKMGLFEFNLRELSGAMGTLFPLVVGYLAVCGLDLLQTDQNMLKKLKR